MVLSADAPDACSTSIAVLHLPDNALFEDNDDQESDDLRTGTRNLSYIIVLLQINALCVFFLVPKLMMKNQYFDIMGFLRIFHPHKLGHLRIAAHQ